LGAAIDRHLHHFSAGCRTVFSEEKGQMGLKWDQAQEIAEVLMENHPGINPLQVRFTDLRQWVADLDEFDDDSGGSSESKLEAIQMAWNEIYEENNEDE
jgi:FeS assembly protein IscX